MDGISTMNLNDMGGDSMTPLFQTQPSQSAPTTPPKMDFSYKPNVTFPQQNPPEKNISKPKGMDSTPISDIMPGEDMLGPVGGGPDPRFMMAQQPMFSQQQMPMPQGYQQQQKPTVESKNPMNLTDDQVEALLAGVVALIAFSGFAQDKLSTMIPKFLNEAGKQSTVGMLVTALLAAVLFYFGRRFVIKD
jgi:hypothetical protein